MRLIDLPEDVLLSVVAYLDFNSLIAFSVAHMRLFDVTRCLLQPFRTEKITKSILDYLEMGGNMLQRLDLSNCDSPASDIDAAIAKCRHIRELSVVNSRLSNMDVICILDDLETLALTAIPHYPEEFGRLKSVRKLYIEVSTYYDLLKFTMRLLNACVAIEVVYINFHDRRWRRRESLTLPPLVAERWNTLHTVVCYRHWMMGAPWARYLLERIFFSIRTPEIREWIDMDQECYIYERGYMNGTPPVDTAFENDINLLRDFHFVNLPYDGSGTKNFKSPWGPPRSLSVKGFTGLLSGLNDCLSTRLTELDLSKCHGEFTEEFRLNLINSAPSLKFLACSRCFLVPDETNNPGGAAAAFLEVRRLTEALESLRLSKVFVRGVCHERECRERCFCEYEVRCLPCRTRSPLGSDSLVDMNGFKHLEELTLIGMSLAGSAFENLANSNVRIVRLCLNAHNGYSGLQEFVQRCSNLECFKLEGFDLNFRSDDLWEALIEARKLRQLCLRTGRKGSAYANFSPKFREFSEHTLQRLEFMHLHRPNPRSIRAQNELFERSKREHLIVNIIVGDSAFLLRNRPGSRYPECYVGRNLCFAEASSEIAEPEAWNKDE